jgi:predicted restriction endonuclease
VRLLRADRRTDGPSRFVFRLEHDQGPADDLASHRAEVEALPGATEREEVRKARVGHGRFRQELLELWGCGCSVTGVGLPAVLTASHIKPWRVASNAERVDPHNGLLLLPQYDRLFDRGYVSFDADGRLLVSGVLGREQLARLGVRESDRLRYVRDEHQPFLEYHRRRVFLAHGREPDG